MKIQQTKCYTSKLWIQGEALQKINKATFFRPSNGWGFKLDRLKAQVSGSKSANRLWSRWADASALKALRVRAARSGLMS